jgi:hypothetical protein
MSLFGHPGTIYGAVFPHAQPVTSVLAASTAITADLPAKGGTHRGDNRHSVNGTIREDSIASRPNSYSLGERKSAEVSSIVARGYAPSESGRIEINRRGEDRDRKGEGGEEVEGSLGR